MAPTQADFEALRAEILSHQGAQTTIVNVAMVATAALAGVALGDGAEPERLQILLALPIVLGGLGLAYLSHSHGAHRIGKYLAAFTDWEKEARKPKSWGELVGDPASYLGVFPGLLIFGAPGVTALVINWDRAPGWMGGEGGEIGALVVADVVVLALALGLMVWVGLSARGAEAD